MYGLIGYNPSLFKGKSVLCLCDDWKVSQFARFFMDNFDSLGLSSLACTSYSGVADISPTLFGNDGEVRGLLYVKERQSDGTVVESHGFLEGNGDYRSDEVTALRDKADFIITNPPFSLFRDFFVWCMESGKLFSIIGTLCNLSMKVVAEQVMAGRAWLGVTLHNGSADFIVPESYRLEASNCGVSDDGSKHIRVKGIRWWTNIPHGRKPDSRELHSMAYNLAHNPHKDSRDILYKPYINFKGIEVPYSDLVPNDYDGIMGVPLSFIDVMDTNMFELLGFTKSYNHDESLWNHGWESKYPEFDGSQDGAGIVDGNGDCIRVFARLLIRKRK